MWVSQWVAVLLSLLVARSLNYLGYSDHEEWWRAVLCIKRTASCRWSVRVHQPSKRCLSAWPLDEVTFCLCVILALLIIRKTNTALTQRHELGEGKSKFIRSQLDLWQTNISDLANICCCRHTNWLQQDGLFCHVLSCLALPVLFCGEITSTVYLHFSVHSLLSHICTYTLSYWWNYNNKPLSWT